MKSHVYCVHGMRKRHQSKKMTPSMTPPESRGNPADGRADLPSRGDENSALQCQRNKNTANVT